MNLEEQLRQEIERQLDDVELLNNVMEGQPEDQRAIIDGLAFYTDDGPVNPDDEVGPKKGPVIMAIGLADKSFFPELATITRQGIPGFAKNRMNPRLTRFYQQHIPVFPDGFMDYVDDVELDDDQEQSGEDTAKAVEEAEQEGATESGTA